MDRAAKLLTIAIGAALTAGITFSQIAPTTAPASQTAAELIVPIHDAADPSAAIQAYATAIAAGHDQTAVESAFVRRMVDFGVPEMALAQAKDLTTKDPNNGLPWAVL